LLVGCAEARHLATEDGKREIIAECSPLSRSRQAVLEDLAPVMSEPSPKKEGSVESKLRNTDQEERPKLIIIMSAEEERVP
jgi:hypothetical protein